MKYEQKPKVNGKTVYILMAVMVLVIVSVAVAVAVAGAARRAKQPNIVVTDPTVTKTPNQSERPNTPDKPDESQKQGDKENPGKTDEPGGNEEPEKPNYQKPLAGSVSKGYDDSVLVFSMTMNDYRIHSGVDIAAALGSQVVAIGDATVKHIYLDPFMGCCIELDLGDGLSAIYQNLSNTLPDEIVEGRKVKAGDVIGAVGETAKMELAEEPHLHFEMAKNGVRVDPGDYLPELATVETGKDQNQTEKTA